MLHISYSLARWKSSTCAVNSVGFVVARYLSARKLLKVLNKYVSKYQSKKIFFPRPSLNLRLKRVRTQVFEHRGIRVTNSLQLTLPLSTSKSAIIFSTGR